MDTKRGFLSYGSVIDNRGIDLDKLEILELILTEYGKLDVNLHQRKLGVNSQPNGTCAKDPYKDGILSSPVGESSFSA